MNTEDVYSLLSDYCRWNHSKGIKQLLKEQPEYVDITYEDGQFFNIAIAKGSVDVLQILLNYYEKNNPQIDSYKLQSGYNLEYANYLSSKNKLHDILKEAYDSTLDISPEIEAILNKYGIPNSESDSDLEENDLSDSDIVSHEVSKSDESNDVILSYNGLKKIDRVKGSFVS